jgi:phage baseplate assembly protein W
MSSIEILSEYAADLTAEGATRAEVIAALQALEARITPLKHDLAAIAQRADDALSARHDLREFGLM